MRNLIKDFTKAEKEALLIECGFTESEAELFQLRDKELSLEQCAELMFVSVKTVSRINKHMNQKIQRIKTS